MTDNSNKIKTSKTIIRKKTKKKAKKKKELTMINGISNVRMIKKSEQKIPPKNMRKKNCNHLTLNSSQGRRNGQM